MTINRALFSSRETEVETPDDIFDYWNSIFHFAIDAAANGLNHKCPWFYSPEGLVGPTMRWNNTDALSADWSEIEGNVWLNPPYGRGLYAWIQKVAEAQKDGITTVCLLPNRTDTRWYQQFIRPNPYCYKDERAGRITFKRQKAGAPFPSVAVVFFGIPTQ